MKKKYITVIICIAVCLCAAVGFANGTFKFDGNMDNNHTRAVLSEDKKLSEETAERAQAVAELALQTDGWDSMNKFEQMAQALNASVENPIEYNDILYNYEYLRRGYHLSNTQMDYIADLIIGGYKPWDVLEICYFWLDTNEDISIVEEIYGQKLRFRGSTWIENAFNFVTDNKCGVLDTEDVDKYLEQGITFDDIMTANKLCRKGVLTIQEILELRKEQKSFAEIAALVNGTGSAAYSLRNEIEAVSVSTEDVMRAETLAKINGEDISVYYQKASEGEKLEELLEEKNESLEEEIDADLRMLYKPMTDEDMDEYMAMRGGYTNEE